MALLHGAVPFVRDCATFRGLPALAVSAGLLEGRARSTLEGDEMETEYENTVVNFVSGFVLGAIVGAGIALLTAPEKGRETRGRIRSYAGELRGDAGDQLESFAGDVKSRIDDALQGAKGRLTR